MGGASYTVRIASLVPRPCVFVAARKICTALRSLAQGEANVSRMRSTNWGRGCIYDVAWTVLRCSLVPGQATADSPCLLVLEEAGLPVLCSVHGQSGTICRVSSWLQGVRSSGDWGGGGQRRAHPTRAPWQSRAAEEGGVAHVRNLEGLR